nr:MAG TPA: hypothetical protein [Caudoviricetes sp.]
MLGKPYTAYLSKNQDFYNFVSDYTINRKKIRENNFHKNFPKKKENRNN